MSATPQLQYYSNFAPNSLTAGVSATSTVFPVLYGSYPWDGPFPYFIAIDRGTATQEICLVNGYSTGLEVTRNYDGNGAFPHSNLTSPCIEIVSPASDWQLFNQHTTNPLLDHHLGLMRTDGGRHNLAANHQLGVNISVGPPTSSSPGDVQADGQGSSLSRSDHVHARTDTYQSYLEYLSTTGMIVPLPTGNLFAGSLMCDGGWYNKADYPNLASKIGQGFTPAPIANPGTGSTPFNPVIHFATPTMGEYTNGVLSWFLSTKWAILT